MEGRRNLKQEKERFEEAGKKAATEIVSYFVECLLLAENIEERMIDGINFFISYSLSLMISDPQNKEEAYLTFYTESILDFSVTHSVPIDERRMNALWTTFFDIHKSLLQLIESEYLAAVKGDHIVEEEIRNAAVSDPDADPMHVKNQPKLIKMDASITNKVADKGATAISLAEITDIVNLEGDLPTLPRQDGMGREIVASTLYDMLHGNDTKHAKIFPKGCNNLVIIDSRYPFEFKGGHISGAVNIWNYKKAMSYFQPSAIDNYTKTVFVFHCEFSSSRGPGLAACFRGLSERLTKTVFGKTDKDRATELVYGMRERNAEDDVKHDYFPHIYILKKGYENFFATYPQLCVPRFYLPQKTKWCTLQNKYCSTIQIKLNNRFGLRGNFVPKFMDDSEYDVWIQCWIQSRISTRTMTDQERIALGGVVQEGGPAANAKGEQKSPSRSPPHGGGRDDITTTTTIIPEGLPPLIYDSDEEEGEENYEDDYSSYYHRGSRGRGRGSVRKRPNKGDGENNRASKRGRGGK